MSQTQEKTELNVPQNTGGIPKDITNGDLHQQNGNATPPVATVVVDDEEVEIETRCGYGPWRPQWMQCCNTPNGLLLAICWFAFIEAFVEWGLVNIYLSTWERRYDLQSTESAWIVSSQDILAGISAPIFGYLGGIYHKGKILTSGGITMTIGCFIFVLAHILVGNYELGAAETAVCDLYGNNTIPCQEAEPSSLSNYLYCFVVAQLFIGYTGSIIYGIGLTYLDDNIESKNFPLYTGIMNFASAVGAVVGFLGGGAALTLYVDVTRVDMDTIDITTEDPRWVGAWWVTFAAAFLASITSTIIICGFTKELPSAAVFRKTRIKDAHAGGAAANVDTSDKEFGKSWRDVWTSIKIVFTNPVFVFLAIGGFLESGVVLAFAAFMPKMLQFQFTQTGAVSAVVAGGVLVPAGAIGQLLGGLIPKWMNLRLRGLIWQIIVCQLFCVAFSFAILLRCDVPNIAGVFVPYPINSTSAPDDLWNTCNSQCNCTTYSQDPICGKDGMEYFSPCFAGCLTEGRDEHNKKIYSNCSCIDEGDSAFDATLGTCGSNCWQFYVFLPFFFLLILATFIESTAGQAAIIKSVPDKQRSFAYGISSTLQRYLGNVPIPILFGFIFDQSCMVWQERCGETGSCWVYSNETMAIGLFAAGFSVKVISAVCNFIAVMLYKPSPNEADLDIIDIMEVTASEQIEEPRDSPEPMTKSTYRSDDTANKSSITDGRHGTAETINSIESDSAKDAQNCAPVDDCTGDKPYDNLGFADEHVYTSQDGEFATYL